MRYADEHPMNTVRSRDLVLSLKKKDWVDLYRIVSYQQGYETLAAQLHAIVFALNKENAL
jgi:hypothetical protein